MVLFHAKKKAFFQSVNQSRSHLRFSVKHANKKHLSCEFRRRIAPRTCLKQQGVYLLALQAGVEPASTVPETAILSVRLLEHLCDYTLSSSGLSAGVRLSSRILRRPTISWTVLSCLTDEGLKSMYGTAPVALMVTRAP